MDVRPINLGENAEQFYLNKIASPNLQYLDTKQVPDQEPVNSSSSPTSGQNHTKTLLQREEELRMRLKATHAQ